MLQYEQERANLYGDLKLPAGERLNSIEDLLRFVESKSAPTAQSRVTRVTHSLRRQSLALVALTAAYLQYYFLDINLQIALLKSLTVFLPVTPLN